MTYLNSSGKQYSQASVTTSSYPLFSLHQCSDFNQSPKLILFVSYVIDLMYRLVMQVGTTESTQTLK